MNYATVPQVIRDDNVDALDHSEKEYNRMISQNMTYHKLLMDDLLKLSTETGSSTSIRNFVQQNIDNQNNFILGLRSTLNNWYSTNQHLVTSASEFKADTRNKSQKVSRFQDFLMENKSKLNEYIDSYQDLVNNNKEGFTTSTNHTMDAALEVSDRIKESHKYILIVIGLISLYTLYKTVKQL